MDDILNGYNGTVFAYGQTGAGKSYTMMGSDIDDGESKGIIPRIVEQIFTGIDRSPGNNEYTVRVSYMEIYMEKIKDLLAPQNDNLPIHEEKLRGVYVKGLLEIYVQNVQEVYEVLRRGGNARATAATNMNQESSRSHSIFVITIFQKNVETGSAKTGQLFLVDLAGSEKVGKTGASGQTLEEAKKINKSLSALGMVINSLTDGKSTHIPYRDSKLTRILQESLGGNSRTTLIINCSPSSFNDAETLSTLKFGVRAKAIKNKAKVNAELSPSELKQLLKKAQNQVIAYESYVVNLGVEVQAWRRGEMVPKERWTSAMSGDSVSHAKAEPRQTTATPSRLHTDYARSETPSRPDSRIGDRSSTPSMILEKDEREEFLRRENELQDQLAEKEAQATNAENRMKLAEDELQSLKETNGQSSKDNENLGAEVNELKIQLERVIYESNEATITVDALKEANSELTVELDEVKQNLLDVRMTVKDLDAVAEEKEKQKADRTVRMMANFDVAGGIFSDNEMKIRECISHIEALQVMNEAGTSLAAEDLVELKATLLETQNIVRQAELGGNDKAKHDDHASRKIEILEKHLANVQRELEESLEGNLSVMDVHEIQLRLEKAYTGKKEAEMELHEELREDADRMAHEIKSLQATIEDLKRRPKEYPINGMASQGHSSKTIQQQLEDFDVMKRSLMRDLQNRCERVVELEISLDETREQYNNVLKTSNNRAQQTKMAILERNLQSLTMVQRQLMEQNTTLKKEAAIAERKLVARNDRIMSLELLLNDSQEKLTAANRKYVNQSSYLT